ncbi:alpha/beta hydrolase [Nocardia huaxiensis]|uniref:Alpha/beta-hydrolase family protein n=1 Tax=Nocardia huaxiensis TaxID=2755382 RepID=A0A7D6VD44_9NOCA|nr:alpha/beta-hydrolase family protein [Nocardia huaxiensis]QLY29535.1 alpha/beta-hydrolase family protein [Nocardia huaxiensis]UFS96905.1 alpha/beta hydrolase [Nocardia huaxiensis]
MTDVSRQDDSPELGQGDSPESPQRDSFVARVIGLLLAAERAIRPNYVGMVVAALFFIWSVSPSLLPRTWIFQGLVSGISAIIGYGVGCVLDWAWRKFVLPQLPAPWREAKLFNLPQGSSDLLKVVTLLAVFIGPAIVLTRSARWQRDIESVMGMKLTPTPGYLRTELLGFATVALVIGVFRLLRWMVRRITRALNLELRIPRAIALPGAVVLVTVFCVLLFQGVLAKAFFSVANSAFSVRNSNTSDYAVQPQLPERSGSPASLAPWNTLGSEGRWFVSNAPTRERIAAVTGKPAIEPIRVYAGLESAPTPEAVAELVVAELDRTHAFERKVLVVVTTTGTGWVDSTTAASIEYMYGGDTAIAATQYSYLPSVLSFLSDRQKATESGRLVIHAVHARWAQLPPESRPKLLVYGESLGSQGSEGAFTGLDDIRTLVDGVLWVGPPNSNRIWSALEQRRDPGTPEILPIYADGLVVRFAATAEDLNRPNAQWISPRIAYLQHASDPIVWWSPDLLFEQPDWLAEPRGADVSKSMRWWPIVTFWQVSADLANAQGVPSGHGHRYGTLVLDGWVAVAQPEGWTNDLADRIRQALDEDIDWEYAHK